VYKGDHSHIRTLTQHLHIKHIDYKTSFNHLHICTFSHLHISYDLSIQTPRSQKLYRLTAKSVGVETKDDVSSQLVKKARVRYVPSTWINNKLLLQNVDFKNVYKANKKKKP
jgi:hypothetical protein